MKALLAITALAAVTLSVGSAIAETLGVTSATLVSAEVGLGVFVAAFTLLAFCSTYSAPRVTRLRRRRMMRPLLPAGEAFAARVICRPARSGARSAAVVTTQVG